MPWRLPCVACSSPALLAVGLTRLPPVFVAEMANCTLLRVQFPSLAPLSLFLALAPSHRDHGLLCWLGLALQMGPGTQGHLAKRCVVNGLDPEAP